MSDHRGIFDGSIRVTHFTLSITEFDLDHLHMFWREVGNKGSFLHEKGVGSAVETTYWTRTTREVFDRRSNVLLRITWARRPSLVLENKVVRE